MLSAAPAAMSYIHAYCYLHPAYLGRSRAKVAHCAPYLQPFTS